MRCDRNFQQPPSLLPIYCYCEEDDFQIVLPKEKDSSGEKNKTMNSTLARWLIWIKDQQGT
jgi:hypothetical protein